MFDQGNFQQGYFAQNLFNGGNSVETPVYDVTGRGGFDRGVGGPGSSYGTAQPTRPLAT